MPQSLKYNIQNLHVVPWYKFRPFTFGFNKFLKAGKLNMVQYQSQIIDHGFLRGHSLI